jgi:serine-type D-Ala-D-Ala carboxypeptidase/endopeptidase (penicillin-binding protein 4)
MNLRIRIAVILLLGFAVALFAFDFGRQHKNSYAFATSDKATIKNDGPGSTSHASATADIELGKAIDRAINESAFASARWGVFVVSLHDGRVLYSRDGDKLFTPASNMKIYTTAVALDLLGADYRWRTSVYAHAEPDANGTVDGDLTLYGRGAPDLVSQSKENQPSLVELADALYSRGVRRVTGNVIGDESYFRGNQFGDGWLWNDVQWYFGAEASALSINANEIDLNVTPASTAGSPATVAVNRSTDYFHIVNNVATAEPGVVPRVGINRGHSDNEFVIWGEFPAGGRGFGARLSVPDPALWAATLFRDALVARGIAVDGQPRRRDFRGVPTEKFDPQRVTELAAVTSKSLDQIITETNKRSLNLNAELILRTLGKERGVMAPVANVNKGRERGDDEAGLAVIRLWLERTGVAASKLALHDGSGLSRLDLVTPEATARLLAAVAKRSVFTAFRSSLPVAGKDGTLASRMPATEGRITAKTGSLTYDDALSGYATTAGGENLAFSIICNDATARGNSSSVIDQIGHALATYPADHQKAPQK